MRSLRSSYQSFLYITRVEKFMFEVRNLRNVAKRRARPSAQQARNTRLLTNSIQRFLLTSCVKTLVKTSKRCQNAESARSFSCRAALDANNSLETCAMRCAMTRAMTRTRSNRGNTRDSRSRIESSDSDAQDYESRARL